MKTLFDKHKWLQIIYGALLIAAGIVVIVLAINDTEQISKWLSIVLAIGLFLFGGCTIAAGLFALQQKYFSSVFIYGALAISIGVVLCIKNTMIGEFITIFVGTLFLCMGAVCCGEAAAMIFFKRNKVSIIVAFIVAAIFITLGVLALVFPETVEKIIYIAIGAIACLIGLLEIVLGIISAFAMKKADKEINDAAEKAPEVIDVQDPKQLN